MLINTYSMASMIRESSSPRGRTAIMANRRRAIPSARGPLWPETFDELVPPFAQEKRLQIHSRNGTRSTCDDSPMVLFSVLRRLGTSGTTAASTIPKNGIGRGGGRGISALGIQGANAGSPPNLRHEGDRLREAMMGSFVVIRSVREKRSGRAFISERDLCGDPIRRPRVTAVRSLLII